MTDGRRVPRKTMDTARWQWSGVLGLSFPVCVFFLLCLLTAQTGSAQTQQGKASFYSKRATGARTANGERLHHDSLTCAHRTYPFGTMLRVTNLSNGKQVVVRVTDRGPFRKGRIIDLSWGAAKAIGMIAQGITAVSVERLSNANIPFRPNDTDEGLPLYDFEVADIPDSPTPIWQHAKGIDDRQARQAMQSTAAKTIVVQPVGTTPASSSSKPPAPQAAKPSRREASSTQSALDDINNKPNQSKAYLKREGSRK